MGYEGEVRDVGAGCDGGVRGYMASLHIMKGKGQIGGPCTIAVLFFHTAKIENRKVYIICVIAYYTNDLSQSLFPSENKIGMQNKY